MSKTQRRTGKQAWSKHYYMEGSVKWAKRNSTHCDLSDEKFMEWRSAWYHSDMFDPPSCKKLRDALHRSIRRKTVNSNAEYRALIKKYHGAYAWSIT